MKNLNQKIKEADNKILNDFNKCKQRVERNIEEFRLDLAMNEAYEFFGLNFVMNILRHAKFK